MGWEQGARRKGEGREREKKNNAKYFGGKNAKHQEKIKKKFAPHSTHPLEDARLRQGCLKLRLDAPISISIRIRDARSRFEKIRHGSEWVVDTRWEVRGHRFQIALS